MPSSRVNEIEIFMNDNISVLVFDAGGTSFDVHSFIDECKEPRVLRNLDSPPPCTV